MNCLRTFFRRRSPVWQFNPWDVLVWPETPTDDLRPQDEFHRAPGTPPDTVPQPPHALEPALQPTSPETAREPTVPPCAAGETDDVLGIGACVIPPWQFNVTEEEMRDTPRTICVSDRDLRRMRALVASALKTHGGVTLEYVRLLSEELRQATILPASRLPRDVVSLNSRVWVTDLNSGERTVVTLVMPDHAAGTPDRISVISPLGMALFGYAAGDRLEWGPFQRPIRLKVDRVRRIRCPHPLVPSHRRIPSREHEDAT